MNTPKFAATKNILIVSSVILTLFSGSLFAQSRVDRQQLDAIQEYCLGCHNFEDYAGSLDLETIFNDGISQHTEEWEKAIRKLRAGMMPPPGQDRPDDRDYLQLTEWLESRLMKLPP